jgi:AraC-like DNA-binding protein
MPSGGGDMENISFSTTAAKNPRKIDEWRDVLSQAFGPIEVNRHSEDNFTGSVQTYRRAQLQFNEIHYRGQTLERTASNIAKFDQEYLTFGRTIAGPLHVKQNGQEFSVESGCLILMNQSLPYTAASETGYHAHSISIPRNLLLQRTPNLRPFYKLQIDDGTPRTALLTSFAKYVEEGIACWSETETIFLREQLLDLIVLLMINDKGNQSSASETSVKAAHRERAIAYIKHNHCDPKLDPASIASACGISVNYLHKLFQSENLQIESFIYAQRLETCKNLLIDPLHKEKTLQQIAYKTGFSHPSHFSRLFKDKFGMSPSDYRMTYAPLADRNH